MTEPVGGYEPSKREKERGRKLMRKKMKWWMRMGLMRCRRRKSRRMKCWRLTATAPTT